MSCASAALGKGAATCRGKRRNGILAGQMPFVTENVDDTRCSPTTSARPACSTTRRSRSSACRSRRSAKPFGVLAVDRIWSDQTEVNFGDDVRFLTMVANLIAQTVKLHDKMAAAQPAAA